MTDEVTIDSIVEAIDADLDWHHKQGWNERAAELHATEDSVSGAAKEQARQALLDHYANRFKPETSRDAMLEQVRKNHATRTGRG